ncbi:helicase-exonuclease AddAB subunit AddA [Bacillus infantis]|uniref:helicase-exonuclease AddAB subunit AddA n=1 Tax=Bacillus infantis TaxID=324767 RepID=UPI00209D33F3|nr:helicase-exonuclease AddAB subunit AddA [Bacillus infantis]MCP1157587.1 helicase-exonuclease AddAB subunit AddA [Bacillus infantis]
MAKAIIPPKPEGAAWTDDQWKAIMASGQDILVAAAAGSGKTAVLVERIINKIVSREEPVNVDELLVVTFTNASAAEMRHRIGEALEKAINRDPQSAHLRKQLSLLSRASISTLHSFCLEVIRKYYYLIDIDPGFRIADETEGQLLRDEVLEELFEEEYGKENNEDFYRLVDAFTSDRSDTALQDIIRELYDFARSNPAPDQYLDKISDMYEVSSDAKLEELPFMSSVLFDIGLQLEGARQLLENALELAKTPGGPAPRAENYMDDIRAVETLIAANNDSWSSLNEAMQLWSFGRAKNCKGDEYDPDLVKQAQKYRDKAKKMIQDLQAEFFSRRPESFIRDIGEMKPHIDVLVRLVRSFSEKFNSVKSEKGLVDFADLEHFCLEILSDPSARKEGAILPSEPALTYRDHFREVLVDEYQDTNMVQEAILQLVTKEGEETGNLFMVGDVKQSIYRFRLAEPNLFLGKYTRFTVDGEKTGLKIDLARNFRSRKEVLDGTNFLFKQVMGKKVGEIDYDQAAELVKGASYPEDLPYPVELHLIDLDGQEKAESGEADETDAGYDLEDLEQSQHEARLMAEKIKEMLSSGKKVYEPKSGAYRPLMYRDIVILLRSMTWAPQIMEEFKKQGIPIYANLSSGYFEATEIAIMMSLLKVIDNPHQDIPLASVLRSPIVGLNEEELAQIRIADKKGSYYEAMKAFCETKKSGDLYDKVKPFFLDIAEWRSMARKGGLSELIWQLYRDTHFYDFAGGMPGGKQRQANLRALYDRARQYEETSFRGLFRFLRFIERMRERGDDLGAARALGEQEDVVRMMTIHSSKGLEFPVVFAAGLARQFNTMDLKKPYLLDKEYGFAAKYVNPEKRISYPSLPQLAFKRKKKMEMLAEEMRVLYVALTRAKEHLFLVASVKNADKKLAGWQQGAKKDSWLLDEYDRAAASSYLDWIGPALIRHRDGEPLRSGQEDAAAGSQGEIALHPSSWSVEVRQAAVTPAQEEDSDEAGEQWIDSVYEGKPVPAESPFKEKIKNSLSWQYSYPSAASHKSKQSVSEMKRQSEVKDEESGSDLVRNLKKPILNRPRFMQEKSMTPAERGTAMHMVMQHADLSNPVTEESIERQLAEMKDRELLTDEQVQVIDPALIAGFFQSPLGQRMRKAARIQREVPFNLALPARTAYPDWKGTEEPVLVQGIIDCIFEDEHGTVLLDFKSDSIHGRYTGGFEEAMPVLKRRYDVQISLYAKAYEAITKDPVDERYLFFFDGGHILKLE